MTFQLVRATDDAIVIWHTDLGHIYGYTACPDTGGLRRHVMREAPDATVPAETFAEAALAFATAEARKRNMLGRSGAKRKRVTACSTSGS